MTTYPLGWQSWSPSTSNWPHLPLWDYNPLKTIDNLTITQLTKKLKPPISLWCSWHGNGTKIDEKLILYQAQKFRSHKYIPQYILIDDGWCNWGDWINPLIIKFPRGIKPIDAIRISKDINSPLLYNIPLLNYLLYIKRKKLLTREVGYSKRTRSTTIWYRS